MTTKLASLFLLLALPFLAACSKSGEEKGTPTPAALPASWFILPENGGSAAVDPPSPDADAAVEAAFRAHTRALEAASGVEPPPPGTSMAGHPADWTPWHLDGMVADFSVTGNGLFGPLLFGGTASVKGFWRRQLSHEKKVPPARKARSVRFSSTMTARELGIRLEPVVRAALATGTVRNAAALRANLTNRSQEFLAVCAALDTLPRARGWHVSGFQLQLSISASGQVTPSIGVGGALNVFFDWEREEMASASPFVRAIVAPAGIARNAPAFVQTFQAVLASLPPEALAIERSGFELDEFQLGVAVGAGGNIGLVQASASVQGKIIFESNSDSFKLASFSQPDLRSKTLTLVNPAPTEAHLAFAQASGVATERWDGGGVAYTLDAERFRAGLVQALRMATFFADHARNVDTRSWKLDEMEVEFDASIQGDLKIVTVYGQGQIVLHFDRVKR